MQFNAHRYYIFLCVYIPLVACSRDPNAKKVRKYDKRTTASPEGHTQGDFTSQQEAPSLAASHRAPNSNQSIIRTTGACVV